jgi:hypothetical protein
MKKITVELKIKLLVHTDEDVTTEKVLEEMDYTFSDQTGQATIVDTEITDWSVLDTR